MRRARQARRYAVGHPQRHRAWHGHDGARGERLLLHRTQGHLRHRRDVFGDGTPATGTVKAVQVGFLFKSGDGDARTIAPVVRQSASDNVCTGVTFNSTTYSYAFHTYDLNPQTAVAWTITDVNTNAEFG